MRRPTKLYAGAAILLPAAIALAPSAARATPYAYASNQITGLTVTNADGTPLSMVTSATTNVNDAAVFAGAASTGFQGSGTVGSALTITQAFSGTGATPPVSFPALGPGSFTGTRGDAAIGAGNASSGGVSVSNVAEGFGTALGNSTGSDSAAITFQVTGTGKAVQVNFTDLAQLIASTAANAQETATASISNAFSITAAGGTTPLATFQPTTLNQQLTSQFGTPPNNSFSNSSLYTFTTPVLTVGTVYNISLSSGARENILPGTTTPGTTTSVPEPATLGLLGAGLLGLGFVSRRKRG